jgi:hypothetical protein
MEYNTRTRLLLVSHDDSLAFLSPLVGGIHTNPGEEFSPNLYSSVQHFILPHVWRPCFQCFLQGKNLGELFPRIVSALVLENGGQLLCHASIVTRHSLYSESEKE